MLEMEFPPSLMLPSLLSPEGWEWYPPAHNQPFWVGEDSDGVRWLVKFRGGFYAVRERAFSVIAQALGVSCQSSTFLKIPQDYPPLRSGHSVADFTDRYQLAVWFLSEHEHGHLCKCCPLDGLNRTMELNPYDVAVLRDSAILHAIDMARGEMLGMLCEMHEPPGHLFTRDHTFVQIDNEQMFSHSAGADLWDSPWVVIDDHIRENGLNEAIQLCKQVLSLPDDVFDQALRLPSNYKPSMEWSICREIENIRPRAQIFLDEAGRNV